MFNSKMKETIKQNEKFIIEIKDFNIEILEYFLHHLYSIIDGKYEGIVIINNISFVNEYIKFCDKYNFNDTIFTYLILEKIKNFYATKYYFNPTNSIFSDSNIRLIHTNNAYLNSCCISNSNEELNNNLNFVINILSNEQIYNNNIFTGVIANCIIFVSIFICDYINNDIDQNTHEYAKYFLEIVKLGIFRYKQLLSAINIVIDNWNISWNYRWNHFIKTYEKGQYEKYISLILNVKNKINMINLNTDNLENICSFNINFHSETYIFAILCFRYLIFKYIEDDCFSLQVLNFSTMSNNYYVDSGYNKRSCGMQNQIFDELIYEKNKFVTIFTDKLETLLNAKLLNMNIKKE
jgi:hypothetical protein